MNRILVTGSNGQLGRSLQRSVASLRTPEFIFTDIAELDLCNETDIRKIPDIYKPGCIINCAAYTAVDKAEEEEAKAMELNGLAVGNLARLSKKHGILLIHLSTDYVFSGKNFRPLTEDQQPDPQSVYATSKYAGEKAILETEGKALIIRTSWLYSEFGRNFAKTILQKAGENTELNVIFDQTGTPTYAGDLADTILQLLPALKDLKEPEILHFSNEGTASWYDFAYAIVSLSGHEVAVNPILTEDYPMAATRPFFSVLDKTKIRTQYGVKIPHWYESLKKWHSNLKNEEHVNR